MEARMGLAISFEPEIDRMFFNKNTGLLEINLYAKNKADKLIIEVSARNADIISVFIEDESYTENFRINLNNEMRDNEDNYILLTDAHMGPEYQDLIDYVSSNLKCVPINDYYKETVSKNSNESEKKENGRTEEQELSQLAFLNRLLLNKNNKKTRMAFLSRDIFVINMSVNGSFLKKNQQSFLIS